MTLSLITKKQVKKLGPIAENVFYCLKCGNRIAHCRADAEMFKKMGYRCPGCWLTINEGRYNKNIKNGITIFAAIGSPERPAGLGDVTVFEVIKRMYRFENKAERIIYLNSTDDHREMIWKHKPDKIFVSEFYRQDTDWILSLPNAIRYIAINEVAEYARKGIYPKLEYDPAYPEFIDNVGPYVALHIRNIEKNPHRPNPSRNMRADFAINVIEAAGGANFIVIIVGNDKMGFDVKKYENVIDMRNKLELQEIAGIIKRSVFFVGRDSGLVHVAAAVNVPIISWGYTAEKWFPHTHAPTALHMHETTEEWIRKKMMSFINGFYYE